MLLNVSTWQEIESWLAKSKTIVVPIGSTEQHGPNGFLGTDALCPEIIAKHAEKGHEDDILVAPTFNIGCAQHHLAFPGTITLRPSTMIASIVDWTDSLTRHGFERIYWFNGHGGNVDTIKTAFAEIHAKRSFDPNGESNRPDLKLKLVNWWDYKSVQKLAAELYPTGHGMHATASEVSVTYFAYPEHQKKVEMSPKIAPMGGISDAVQYRRDFPDGRIGSDPTQSCVEHGQRLVETSAAALLEDVARFAR